MQRLGIICDHLESLAPARLSAEWDNVGLLVGDREAEIARMLANPESMPEEEEDPMDLFTVD